MSPRYFLTPHAFLSCIDGNAIFLDLRRNEYCALDGADTATLIEALTGESPAEPDTAANTHGFMVRLDSQCANDAQNPPEILRELCAQGLLTEDARRGKGLNTLEIATPAPLPLAASAPLRIRFGHVLRFLQAYACAALLLRFGSVERAVRRVQTRKHRASERGHGKAPRAQLAGRSSTASVERVEQQREFSEHLAAGMSVATPVPASAAQAADLHERRVQLQELVRIFSYLRPFVFTASKQCLLNSLTLLEFLAKYDLHPRWVFGVQISPFLAHCWVQDGSWVLNGSAQFTGDFKPIMTV